MADVEVPDHLVARRRHLTGPATVKADRFGRGPGRPRATPSSMPCSRRSSRTASSAIRSSRPRSASTRAPTRTSNRSSTYAPTRRRASRRPRHRHAATSPHSRRCRPPVLSDAARLNRDVVVYQLESATIAAEHFGHRFRPAPLSDLPAGRRLFPTARLPQLRAHHRQRRRRRGLSCRASPLFAHDARQ